MGDAARSVVTLWAAVFALSGCNAIFGLEAGEERPPGSIGGSHAGGSSAGGGIAGIGGTPTGTGAGGMGAGGTAGSGGTGGQPPTFCTAYSMGECGGGMKCSVYDVDGGAWGCVAAGPRPAWSYCQHDIECQEGAWCDLESSVCKPICQSGNDCGVGANCHPAAGNGPDIPGLQICTAYCDPMDAQACSQTFGTTNCIVTDTISFDCYASGTAGAYEDCSDPLDCGPGLGCYTIMMTSCRDFCYVANDNCPWPWACMSFTPALFYDGEEYGACG